MDNVVLNRCVTSVKRQNSAKEFILISSVHEVLVRSLMSNVDVTSHNVSDGMNLERERERERHLHSNRGYPRPQCQHAVFL